MHIFKKRRNIYKGKLQNKAQASFFVVVGLVMFIAVIVGFFAYNKIKSSKIQTEAEKAALALQAEEIKKFVNDCIRKTTYDGLKKLGQTGGYFEVPDLINFKGTGYWHLDQINIQPFLNQTQQRLLEYVNANIPVCVENGNLTKFGFLVEKKKPIAFMEFGNSDVTIKVIYPIKLSKEDFTKELSEFFNTFDIRYRAIFEAATETNEKTFDGDFDAKEPLKKLDYLKNLDFDIAYKTPETDVLVFAITDKKSFTPENQNYVFNFAAKLGRSELKKLTDMQNKSATNPTFLPYTIFSVDKKAQLDIAEGTTVSLNSSDVSFISVQQAYPSEVTTKDVPVYKKNSEVMQRQDIKYVIDNPVYSFEPSGILFNKFQKLTLYYDNETKAEQGVGILMGKKGFWVPIVSFDEPQYKRVFSNILGFTEFTAIYCSSQQLKKTIAEHFFEPKATCYVSLAITVIAIIVAVVAIVGVIAASVASAGGAVGASTAITAGSGATGLTGLVESIGANILNGIGAITGTTVTAAGSSLLVGSLAITLSTISIAASILGATTDIFYGGSPDNCESFYPTCAQTITIEKEEKDGTGKCIPEGSAQAAAGQQMLVCAQVKKCNTIQKYLCMPCSVKCTASFY